MQRKYPALLIPVVWGEGATATTDQTAEGAENNSGNEAARKPNGNTPNGEGNPQPPAANGGQEAPASSESGNEPAKITLTEAELNQRVQNAVTAALNDHKQREARSAQRAQNQKTREKAEADEDFKTLLEVERTEHGDTKAEVARLTGEVATLNRRLIVSQVVNKYKLDSELAELLEGNASVTDEASAEKFAKTLTKYRKTTPAPPTDTGSGNRPAPKKKPEDGEGKRYGWQGANDVAYPE